MAEIKDKRLAELVEQMQAGDEVLLTQDQKLVAKLIAIGLEEPCPKPGESKTE